MQDVHIRIWILTQAFRLLIVFVVFFIHAWTDPKFHRISPLIWPHINFPTLNSSHVLFAVTCVHRKYWSLFLFPNDSQVLVFLLYPMFSCIVICFHLVRYLDTIILANISTQMTPNSMFHLKVSILSNH